MLSLSVGCFTHKNFLSVFTLNKFRKFHFLLKHYIRTLNTTGRDLQINNSTDYYNLYVNSFNSTSLPYTFNLSESLSGGLSKTDALAIFKGREGVVTKDSTDFYFAIGDITLNGEVVDFIELPDTVLINSLQTMNEYLISEPFSATSSSSLTYGVQYGIIDSAASVAALIDGSEINFKVELIDNQSGEVLGVFDKITFSSENILQYNNIGY